MGFTKLAGLAAIVAAVSCVGGSPRQLSAEEQVAIHLYFQGSGLSALERPVDVNGKRLSETYQQLAERTIYFVRDGRSVDTSCAVQKISRLTIPGYGYMAQIKQETSKIEGYYVFVKTPGFQQPSDDVFRNAVTNCVTQFRANL